MSEHPRMAEYLAALFTAPLLTADAIVVLCGEDAEGRGDVAVELLTQQAAPVIVCAGGLDDPPRRMDGVTLSTQLLTKGIAPDRLIVESGSQNTHEQAVHVVEMAEANQWKRLLIVASAYHLPRAFLTFIKAVGDRDLRLVPMAPTHLSWWYAPPGMDTPRIELLKTDLAKIAQYADHCATVDEGIAYLERTDRR